MCAVYVVSKGFKGIFGSLEIQVSEQVLATSFLIYWQPVMLHCGTPSLQKNVSGLLVQRLALATLDRGSNRRGQYETVPVVQTSSSLT